VKAWNVVVSHLTYVAIRASRFIAHKYRDLMVIPSTSSFILSNVCHTKEVPCLYDSLNITMNIQLNPLIIHYYKNCDNFHGHLCRKLII